MKTRADSRALFFLRDLRRDAHLLARQADVGYADLVAERVAVDAERARRAPEISGRPLHRADDVLLLEFLLGEVERDAVSQQLIDDFLELSIQIHVPLPENQRMRSEEARILAKERCAVSCPLSTSVARDFPSPNLFRAKCRAANSATATGGGSDSST